MHIVSVPGRLVRDPATHRFVDEVGIEIDEHDLNWARLLADGDVAEGDGLPSSEPETPAPAAQTPASARRAPAQEA